MSSEKLYVHGELYLSLEKIAEIYEIQIVVLEEAYRHGLFGSGLDSGPKLCIAAVNLDRVATVVRLNKVLGLDVDTIVLSLGELPRPAEP